ncbi:MULTISPECIES: DUF7352 domain-containing protein [unclassified Streptosporangium]|uniref:DUF7352 domain-containing protein n=1 Tax=unclassified Streptosporangium TaxID=2632669 RepID=UPI003FA3BB9D
MARCMLRYQVVVNDRPQGFKLGGNPVHVEAARLGAGPQAQHLVEFWAEGRRLDGTEIERTFQVFGTGHPLPEGARWWGTTARTPEGLVWHLYEVPSGEGQGQG